MAQTWLHNQDLLENPNSKELPPDQAFNRFWALYKCQFGETVGEAAWHAFLYHLLPCEDKHAAAQMDITQLWDPKFHLHLDLINTVPIREKLPFLFTKKKA